MPTSSQPSGQTTPHLACAPNLRLSPEEVEPAAPAEADVVEEDSGAEGEFEDFLDSDKSVDFVSQEEWGSLKKMLGSRGGSRTAQDDTDMTLAQKA